MNYLRLIPALLLCLSVTALGNKTIQEPIEAKTASTNKLPEWALGGFVRPDGVNPVITPNPNSKFDCPMQKAPVGWEESDTFNPAAVVKDGKIYVLYRAEDNSAQGIGMRTSRIGLAESTDGVTMKRRFTPVMYPAEYQMYWGESMVAAATSDDLINWTPVLNEQNELLGLIYPREKCFDSALTECGPPAILTDKGILLLYNGKNQNDDRRDPRFNAGTYSAGQVLFDLNDPYKAIARLDVPFFRPIADFEKSGQYRDGTVFIEGLTFYKDKWYLYYGCADSQVGVAIYDPAKKTPGDPIK